MIWMVLLLFLMMPGQSAAFQVKPTELSDVSPKSPSLNEGGAIYADIDTVGNRLFLLVEEGLWEFDLRNKRWSFLDSLKAVSSELDELEFGYNPEKELLQLWSGGWEECMR